MAFAGDNCTTTPYTGLKVTATGLGSNGSQPDSLGYGNGYTGDPNDNSMLSPKTSFTASSSGTLTTTGSPGCVGFDVNTAGLTAGTTYHGTLVVSGTGANPGSYLFSFLVTAAPSVTPALATAVKDASNNTGTSFALETSVHDTATLTASNGTPTGTVTFKLYKGGTCAAQTGTQVGSDDMESLSSGAVDSSASGPLNADSYYYLVTYASGDTSTWNSISTPYCEDFSIAAAAVTMTAGSYSHTYDGASHSPSACAVTGTYTGALTCHNSPALVGPDVGSGSVTPVLDLNGENADNFSVTPVNGSWSITAAPVTITAGGYSGTYDGASHDTSACVVTADAPNTYKGALTCTNDPTSVKDAGSGSVTPVLALNGETASNFSVTSVDGSWTIAAAAVTMTAGSYSHTYDGASHSPSACAVTGTYTGALTCHNSPALVGPDVGSGSVTPVLDLNGENADNFSVTPVNGSWSITPANIEVVVNGGSKQVDDPGSGSASDIEFTVDLSAGTPDVGTATLVVTLGNVAGGSPITASCVKGATSADTKTITWTCTLGSLPLGVYEITAVAGGNYTGTGYDMYAIYDPSLGFATGGGTFSIGTERVNFGFVMKYNKSGANLQGQFVAVRHHADGTISKIKSNSLTGLAITQPGGCGVATFGGKSSYMVWDPVAKVYTTTGGILFSVVASDCNQPGNGFDTIKISGGAPDFQMASAATLSGGNIVVPHTASTKK